MKGIKKLFYGLVLMALISVGFKIEAKAEPQMYLEVTSGLEDDWSSTDTTLTAKFKAVNYDFPEINTVPTGSDDFIVTATYKCKIEDSDTVGVLVGDSVNVQLITERKLEGDPATDRVYHYIKLPGDSTPKLIDTTKQYPVVQVSKSTVKSAVKTNKGTATATIHEKVKAQGELISTVPSPSATPFNYTPGADALESATEIDIKLGKVNANGYYNASKLNSVVVTGDGEYLLPKEQLVLTIGSKPSDNYQFIKWTDGATSSVTDAKIAGSSIDSCTVTQDATPVEKTIKVWYGTLTFNPEIDESFTVKAGNASTARTYTFVGYNAAGGDVYKVYIDNETTLPDTVSWTSGLVFTPKSTTTEGEHELIIKMSDEMGGGTFTRKFSVDNEENVKLDSVIYVTEGCKVNLYSYVKNSDVITNKKQVKASITDDAKSYASLSTTSVTAIGNILVVGDSPTKDTAAKTGKKQLILYNSAGKAYEDGKASITVYPKPVVTVNPSSSSSSGSLSTTTTSSSSSSTDTPLRIEIPTGVYNGTRAWSDVKRATVIFSVSGKDIEKTLDMTTSVGSSSDPISKYANVNSMALSSVLKDLCGGDSSKEVTVRAYPNNGSGYDPDVYGEAKFTAYKITLDTTGGAKYTVNGTEVSDGYFYGVDGTTYTLKSSATNGGTLDKTNSGDFNNGESITLKVLGARTLKAVYESKSSNKSSGAAGDAADMDDYDDVPKTGESKTDIWILWSVLLVSILGAGFMIWKRFGLVRAIAEAEEEVAIAEHEEKVEAEAKEKESKLNMLKDLRNL